MPVQGAVEVVYALPQHLQCHLWLAMLEDPALLASKAAQTSAPQPLLTAVTPPPLTIPHAAQPPCPGTLSQLPPSSSLPQQPPEPSCSLPQQPPALGSYHSVPLARLLIRVDSPAPEHDRLPDWQSTSSIWPMAALRLEDSPRGQGSSGGKHQGRQGDSLAAPQPVLQLLSDCGLCRSSFMAHVQLGALERLAAAVAGSQTPCSPCSPSLAYGETDMDPAASYRAALPQHLDCSQCARFATLNEITAGQEEVDDTIQRDIHRTFPEHPLFRSPGPGPRSGGQEALFRLLKAFSLHDLEVSYCQGMAFAAGVLLTCLPEEPAFRLFCKLMDAKGPNLRRMYLPELEALKEKLVAFEVLLELHLPRLHLHLRQLCIPSVLYLTQWLMTLWAAPFGTHFSACVIDIMLLAGTDVVLLHIALGVVELLEVQLLHAPSFEQAFTALKTRPAEWGVEERNMVMRRALHYSSAAAAAASAGPATPCSTPCQGAAAATAPPTPRVTLGAVQKLSKVQSQRYQGDSPMGCPTPAGPDSNCEAVHKLEGLIQDLEGRASQELELDPEAIKAFVLWSH